MPGSTSRRPRDSSRSHHRIHARKRSLAPVAVIGSATLVLLSITFWIAVLRRDIKRHRA